MRLTDACLRLATAAPFCRFLLRCPAAAEGVRAVRVEHHVKKCVVGPELYVAMASSFQNLEVGERAQSPCPPGRAAPFLLCGQRH